MVHATLLHLRVSIIFQVMWRVMSLSLMTSVANRCTYKRECPHHAELYMIYSQCIDCSELQLQAFPNNLDLNRTADAVDLRGNNLRRISTRDFGDFSPLLFLDLSHNQIVTLENNWARNLSNTQYLYLSSNIISIVSNATFFGLDLLQYLYIDTNSIRMLKGNAFGKLPHLQSLGLQNNTIRNLRANAFLGLVQLRRLDLSDNFIQSLVAGAFFGLDRLLELLLSNNRIHDIPQATFEHLSALQHLRIDNNDITHLRGNTFQGLMELIELDVEENAISSFQQDWCKDLDKLQDLNMSYNSLENFPKGAFNSCSNIVILDFHHNHLKELPGEIFKSLKHNFVADLRFNNLSTLGLITVQETVDIRLEGNPLQCDCRLKWLKDGIENGRIQSLSFPKDEDSFLQHHYDRIASTAGGPVCVGPGSMSGRPIVNVSDRDLIDACIPALIPNGETSFEATAGDTLTVVCPIAAVDAKFSWILPSFETIEVGETKERKTVTNNSDLIIMDAATTDSGSYKCSAYSVHGQKEVALTVYIAATEVTTGADSEWIEFDSKTLVIISIAVLAVSLTVLLVIVICGRRTLIGLRRDGHTYDIVEAPPLPPIYQNVKRNGGRVSDSLISSDYENSAVSTSVSVLDVQAENTRRSGVPNHLLSEPVTPIVHEGGQEQDDYDALRDGDLYDTRHRLSGQAEGTSWSVLVQPQAASIEETILDGHSSSSANNGSFEPPSLVTDVHSNASRRRQLDMIHNSHIKQCQETTRRPLPQESARQHMPVTVSNAEIDDYHQCNTCRSCVFHALPEVESVEMDEFHGRRTLPLRHSFHAIPGSPMVDTHCRCCNSQSFARTMASTLPRHIRSSGENAPLGLQPNNRLPSDRRLCCHIDQSSSTRSKAQGRSENLDCNQPQRNGHALSCICNDLPNFPLEDRHSGSSDTHHRSRSARVKGKQQRRTPELARQGSWHGRPESTDRERWRQDARPPTPLPRPQETFPTSDRFGLCSSGSEYCFRRLSPTDQNCTGMTTLTNSTHQSGSNIESSYIEPTV